MTLDRRQTAACFHYATVMQRLATVSNILAFNAMHYATVSFVISELLVSPYFHSR